MACCVRRVKDSGAETTNKERTGCTVQMLAGVEKSAFTVNASRCAGSDEDGFGPREGNSTGMVGTVVGINDIEFGMCLATPAREKTCDESSLVMCFQEHM